MSDGLSNLCDRIGVDQQQGGGDYPFVEPSDDVRQAVLDAYLAYEDPALALEWPLRIDWLYGFGVVSASPPAGTPTPTHAYDLRIVDNVGTVVFDSTTGTYKSKAWGGSRLILQWQTATAVCRVVACLNAAATTPVTFKPLQSPLDSRTCNRLPLRVRSLQSDSSPVLTATDVFFAAGFNTSFVQNAVTSVDGGRVLNDITVSASPGAGLGRTTGCVESQLVLRTINGQAADNSGNLLLTATDCYSLTVPATLSSDVPGRIPRREAIAVAHTLLLHNDCGPCCDCSDYMAVYEAVRKLRNTFYSMGQRAMALRDLLRTNIERWNAAGLQRLSSPLRLSTFPLSCCRLSVTGAYCNATGSLKSGVRLKFDLSGGSTPPASVICGSSFRAGNFVRTNSTQAGFVSPSSLEPYAMEGTYPNFSALFDGVPDGGLAMVSFQLDLAGCDTADAAHISLSAVDPATDDPLTYNAAWPNGHDPQPVTALGVHSGLLPNDPCDESACGDIANNADISES